MIAGLWRLAARLLLRGRSATQAHLEILLGESTHDLGLYEQALRHRSAGDGTYDGRLRSNERLEHLGDAVLGMLVAEHLYKEFPGEMEGFLTALRAKLVKGTALANVARAMGIGAAIEMSNIVVRQGGRDQDSILADTYEAIVGALYLDRGLGAARRFVYRTMLEDVDLAALAARPENFKSLLQQFVQDRGWPLPTYEVVSTEGPGHARVFTVEAKVGDRVHRKGKASSRKVAEQVASRAVLHELKRQEANQARAENYKGRLNTFLSARGEPPAKYKIVDQQGPPHKLTFTAEVRIGAELCATAQGTSKKGAEHNAARKVLEELTQRTAGSTNRSTAPPEALRP